MKKLFFILCIVSILVFPLASGCGRSNTNGKKDAAKDEAGYKQYNNTTFGYNMLYPRNWVIQGGLQDSIVFFVGPNIKGVRPNVYVNFFDLSQQPQLSLDQFKELDLNVLNTNITDFKLVSSVKTTVNKLPAYKITYTGTTRQIPMKYVQFVTFRDKSLYFITYVYKTDKFDDFLPEVNKMVESFSF